MRYGAMSLDTDHALRSSMDVNIMPIITRKSACPHSSFGFFLGRDFRLALQQKI